MPFRSFVGFWVSFAYGWAWLATATSWWAKHDITNWFINPPRLDTLQCRSVSYILSIYLCIVCKIPITYSHHNCRHLNQVKSLFLLLNSFFIRRLDWDVIFHDVPINHQKKPSFIVSIYQFSNVNLENPWLIPFESSEFINISYKKIIIPLYPGLSPYEKNDDVLFLWTNGAFPRRPPLACARCQRISRQVCRGQ